MASPYKHGGAFDHYNSNGQQANKRHRSDQPPYNRPLYDKGSRNGYEQQHRGNNFNKAQGRGGHVGQQQSYAPVHQETLSAVDMQTGLVALLDRFVADEASPTADRDILHHASELRKLLYARKEGLAAAETRNELDKKRPDKTRPIHVPDYVYRKVQAAKSLPPLPPIATPYIHDAVFTHRTFQQNGYNPAFVPDVSLDYERLEYLGDAYIELIASRALYNRFPHIDVPSLCSWRERMVENVKLAEFSDAYGFFDRLRANTQWEDGKKSHQKVAADIFEAYVAGVIISDPENGFSIAEAWLDELWAPQLLSFKEKVIVNPLAKTDLHNMLHLNGIKLDYREEKKMTYDKNHKQHYSLGVYLTGWGYENEWLGSGEGQNKVEAGCNAATDALQRNSAILQDAAKQRKETLDLRLKTRELEEALKKGEDGVDKGAEKDSVDVADNTARGESGIGLQEQNLSDKRKMDDEEEAARLEKKRLKKEKKERKKKEKEDA